MSDVKKRAVDGQYLKPGELSLREQYDAIPVFGTPEYWRLFEERNAQISRKMDAIDLSASARRPTK